MGKTLLQKVWDLHTVRQLPSGQTQLFIGLHLIHEVTTPQAFDELRARGWKVARPDRTFATTDTTPPRRPITSFRQGAGSGRFSTSWPKTCWPRSNATSATSASVSPVLTTTV